MGIDTTPMPVSNITYKQASDQLGIAPVTLKQAIKRGMLTPIPRQGLERYLIAEQVSLFQGKRLSFASLNKEQMETWKRYREIATGTTSTQIDPRGFAYSPDTMKEIFDEIARLIREGKVPQGTPLADFLSTAWHVIRLVASGSLYVSNQLSEDDIRSILYPPSQREREIVADTIEHMEVLKPLKERMLIQEAK